MPHKATPPSKGEAGDQAGEASDAQTLALAVDQLGLQLSQQQIQQLLQYRDALVKWNKVYNLTSVRQPQEMLHQHLIDCLALVPAIERELKGARAAMGGEQPAPWHKPHILDVGSGGGLPGVVLAICLPDIQVDCIDAVGKKAAFVRQVAAELMLPNLKAVHARVENHQPPVASKGLRGYDLITSRAFASLADFTNWTRHLLGDQGVWAAMKGVQPTDELNASSLMAELFHVEPLRPPGLDAQRCLVWLRPPANNRNRTHGNDL